MNVLNRAGLRIGSRTYTDPDARPAALVGTGGQLLLLERPPFCPIRDCHKPCGPGPKCTCRICFCSDCRARRARLKYRRPAPRLVVTPTPYTPPAPVQRALFPTPTVRPRRRTP